MQSLLEIVKNTIVDISKRNGKPLPNISLDILLSDIEFTSLDFAELCARMENITGRYLTVNNPRSVLTIGNAVNFFQQNKPCH